MSDERWKRIDRVLQSALSRPPHEREAFVRDACGDDEAASDEVLSLLAHEGSAENFLDLASAPKREPLKPGARLGAYEIRAQIGEGGMGEVYRAYDSRLRRDIALKILPPEAADAERRQRFAREAQAVAALNHPGIVTIHSVEQSGDINFLTMELVDGQTLDALTPAGGLPVDRLLAIAIPLADAVGTGHSHGIVHRDLKPANVMVTRDGRVKVMDFGLAKLTRRASLLDANDGSLTKTASLTEDGRIIGTVAYMSPEQAEGREVDHRSDVFSLGVMLFELATGRRPFAGDSQVAILASIVKDTPPPVTTVRPGLPHGFARLVGRSLAKDPARRYQSVLDLRHDLEAIKEDLASPVQPGDAEKQRRFPIWLTAALGAALILSVGASAAYWWRPREAPSDPGFANVTDDKGIEESPAISPDGKTLAFVAYTGRRRQIWIRVLNGGGATQVTHDDMDHEQPRWVLPNSSRLLYFTRPNTEDSTAPQGKLWEIGMLGKDSVSIAPALGGGDISHDGLRIATFQLIDDLPTIVVLRRDGTLQNKVATVRAGGRTLRWSPDDQSIAYIELGVGTFANRLMVVPAAGGQPREVDSKFSFDGLSWLPDGSGLVYGSAQGSTVGYPPTYQLRRKGLADDRSKKLTLGDDSYIEPDVHLESGALYATRNRIRSAISRVPTGGSAKWNAENAVAITRQTSQVQVPSASPNGNQVVYLSDSGGNGNLWVTDADGLKHSQITSHDDPLMPVGVPVWSTDGTRIVYLKGNAAPVDQMIVNPDGSGRRRLLSGGVAVQWSPDGKWLYYNRPGSCIYKLRVVDGLAESEELVRCDAGAPVPRDDGTLFFQKSRAAPNGGFDYELRKAKPEGAVSSQSLLWVDGRRLPYDAKFAIPTALSPDGKWIAYVEMDGATTNIWKVSTDDGGKQKVRITDFGERALWIVRQISWRGDFIYAALADVDSDIVSITGIVKGTPKKD